MPEHEYTIALSRGEWDRATIFLDEDGWYYSLRRADPHGEEFVEEPVGPFGSAEEAERRARTDFISPDFIPPEPEP